MNSLSNTYILLILPTYTVQIMKKRQIWALGIIIWQAIMMIKKDPVLREKVKTEPWLLKKWKILGESWIEQNKEIFENIKNIDVDNVIKELEKNVKIDAENIQKRTQEQDAKDWEGEWRATIRNIISSIPTKKKLADWVEKYKQHIIQWRDNL